MFYYTQAESATVGTAPTSKQRNKLAKAFSDRLEHGAGDCAWRIVYKAHSLVRKANYNAGYLSSCDDDWWTHYCHIDPRIHGSVSWGNDVNEIPPAFWLPYDEQGWLGIVTPAPTSPAPVNGEDNAAYWWRMGEYQRGTVDPSKAVRADLAMTAARGYYAIQAGCSQTASMLRKWGGWLPSQGEHSYDVNGDTTSIFYVFAPLKPGLTKKTYTTAQATAVTEDQRYYYIQGTPTAWDNDAAYGIESFVSYGGYLYRCLVAHNGHTPTDENYWKCVIRSTAYLALLPKDEYLAIGYGPAGLASGQPDAVEEILQNYTSRYRGSDAQRADDNYRIDSIGFDFQTFFSKQYPLAPQYGEFNGNPDAPAWQTATSYSIGSEVSSSGYFYRSLQAHTSSAGNSPPNVDYWLPIQCDPRYAEFALPTDINTWDAVPYSVGDVVFYVDKYYQCKQPTVEGDVSVEPVYGSNWQAYWSEITELAVTVTDGTNTIATLSVPFYRNSFPGSTAVWFTDEQRVALGVTIAGKSGIISGGNTAYAPHAGFVLFGCKAEMVISESTNIKITFGEIEDRKPTIEDAYLVLRMMTTGGDNSSLDNPGDLYSLAKTASDLFATSHCIVSNYSVQDTDVSTLTMNPVYDAARKMIREHIRCFKWETTEDVPSPIIENYYTEGENSVLQFKRYLDWGGDRFDMWDGIAPPDAPIASGKLLDGMEYKVTGTGNVTYNGQPYATGSTFTAVNGVKTYTADTGAYVFQVDGIIDLAPESGETNEWVFFMTSTMYGVGQPGFDDEDYSHPLGFLHNRCMGYHDFHLSALDSLGMPIYRALGTEYGAGIVFESPHGYNYVDGHNSSPPSEFAYSCPIYPKPYKLKSVTVTEDGESVIVVCDKLQSSPESIDTEYRSDENTITDLLFEKSLDLNCPERIGDHSYNPAPDDHPNYGACRPRFYFVKLPEQVRVDQPADNDTLETTDTRCYAEPMAWLYFVLDAISEGFIDHWSRLSGEGNSCSGMGVYRIGPLMYQASGGVMERNAAANRWLSLLSNTLRPDKAMSNGPWPNTIMYADEFNWMVNAINLLNTVPIHLPSTREYQRRVFYENTTSYTDEYAFNPTPAPGVLTDGTGWAYGGCHRVAVSGSGITAIADGATGSVIDRSWSASIPQIGYCHNAGGSANWKNEGAPSGTVYGSLVHTETKRTQWTNYLQCYQCTRIEMKIRQSVSITGLSVLPDEMADMVKDCVKMPYRCLVRREWYINDPVNGTVPDGWLLRDGQTEYASGDYLLFQYEDLLPVCVYANADDENGSEFTLKPSDVPESALKDSKAYLTLTSLGGIAEAHPQTFINVLLGEAPIVLIVPFET